MLYNKKHVLKARNTVISSNDRRGRILPPPHVANRVKVVLIPSTSLPIQYAFYVYFYSARK